MDIFEYIEDNEFYPFYERITRPQKPRTIRERIDNYSLYDDEEFRTRYRLTKKSVFFVLGHINPDIETKTNRNDAISPMNRLLLTLRYYATGSFLVAAGDLSGVSKASASRIVFQVSDAIAKLRPLFITFPSNLQNNIMGFFNIAKFPRVIGAIDCTHIKIKSPGFLEDCDDTIIELSKLSLEEHNITLVEKLNEQSRVIASAREYVLRRCNQTELQPFDECYPHTALKNCRKIGEGVYGEVYLWRAPDGRPRVMKVVPIAGTVRVNGESQKHFHEIISEIVIAMELSALRAPIAEIECHFDEGKEADQLDLHAVENATDVFNEVLAVRCVFGSYPCRLLDLWDLYDECKGSENDNPRVLPDDQQYIVLELANAGQDLESYQFNTAEQAHALLLQVAFGLAVGEEAFQFEHRDLHWGNVLIAPTDQKYASFVLRGRSHRVLRCGVAATIIDYSLSRVSLPVAGESCALYNDLAADEGLFDAVGDYQFEVYRRMRDKLTNEWKRFEPYTNVLWLHYLVDKMITSVHYKRTSSKLHKQYIAKLKSIKNRLLDYGSAVQFVLTDSEF